MKAITATALLSAGAVTPDAAVPCPGTTVKPTSPLWCMAPRILSTSRVRRR